MKDYGYFHIAYSLAALCSKLKSRGALQRRLFNFVVNTRLFAYLNFSLILFNITVLNDEFFYFKIKKIKLLIVIIFSNVLCRRLRIKLSYVHVLSIFFDFSIFTHYCRTRRALSNGTSFRIQF